MENGISVSTSGIGVQANNTINNSEDLFALAETLKSQKDQIGEIWQGGAFNEFAASVDTQVGNLTKLSDVFQRLGMAINRGAAIFDQAEEDNIRLASQIND